MNNPGPAASAFVQDRSSRLGLDTSVLQTLLLPMALRIADVAAMAIAVSAALRLSVVVTGEAFPMPDAASPQAWLGAGLLVAALGWQAAVSGRYRHRVAIWLDFRRVMSFSLVLSLVLMALGLVSGQLALMTAPVIAAASYPIVRAGAGVTMKYVLDRAGLWTLPIVVVGDRAAAAELTSILRNDPALGYRVVQQIDAASAMRRLAGDSLQDILGNHGARHVIFADIADPDLRTGLVKAALREQVAFAAAPAMPSFHYDSTWLSNPNTVLFTSRLWPDRHIARLVKSALDLTVAAALLALIWPVMAMIALAVRADGGPALFRHRRLGAGGKTFDCLKFRSMCTDADAVLRAALLADPALADEWRCTQKLRHDPRVTTVGRLLRATSLDELPQLFNVLRLEMSLVGPRPIVESERAKYGDDIASYLAVRPGLTGLWQVSGRSNTSYRRRVELDVQYVETWTNWLDLVILFRTIPAVLAREGAR